MPILTVLYGHVDDQEDQFGTQISPIRCISFAIGSTLPYATHETNGFCYFKNFQVGTRARFLCVHLLHAWRVLKLLFSFSLKLLGPASRPPETSDLQVIHFLNFSLLSPQMERFSLNCYPLDNQFKVPILCKHSNELISADQQFLFFWQFPQKSAIYLED